MIQTWAADVTALYEQDVYKKYYEKVPDFRQEKANKLRTAQGKAQSVGVWFLLMQMRQTYGLSEKAVFNLSHSGQYVLCSIDDSGEEHFRTKVGCDIEVIGKFKEKIAKRFFCNSEIDYILSREAEIEKIHAFYRYWVLKESFLKATRLGMKLDMRSFEIQLKDERNAVLASQPQEIKETYYYYEYTADGIAAKIAVCSTEKEFGQLGTPHLFK